MRTKDAQDTPDGGGKAGDKAKSPAVESVRSAGRMGWLLSAQVGLGELYKFRDSTDTILLAMGVVSE